MHLKNKLKDLYILTGFTILIAFTSLLFMDIIIFPISIFAVKNKKIFNDLIKYLSLLSLIFILIIYFLRKIYNLIKKRPPAIEYLKFFLLSPFKSFLFFLISILTLSLIIIILYITLNYNDYLFYKLLQ